MGKPGTIAFPVLLVLGAITGYLTYTYFTAAIPQEGFVDSPYRTDVQATAGNDSSAAGDDPVDPSQFSNVVTISILEGASVQGSDDYDPDAATAGSDALITWVNEDTIPHTSTSGTGQSDSESGQLFDSGILAQGMEYSVPAADLGAGDHTYYCTVHPYMMGTITIE